MRKKIILFGAGTFGKNALDYIGEDKVQYYVDNNNTIVGTIVNGKKVISFDELKRIYSDYSIIISVDVAKTHVLAKQLDDAGIHEYTTYLDIVKKYVKPNMDNTVDWIAKMKLAEKWIINNTVYNEGIINNSEYRKSYPEVTGYYIPTLLKWGYRDLAKQYTRWLCSIQHNDGSWYDTEGTAPYVFDTAQILKGLVAMADIMPEIKVNIAKGCDWMLSRIDGDGRLVTPTKEAWGKSGECSELIHLYCLTPLIDAAKILDVPQYESEARRVQKYYINNYRKEILDFSFLSHFYAYVMEALCNLGEYELAKEAMKSMSDILDEKGYVPAYRNVNWVCSTGMFQLAIVWYELGDIERGNKALEYAAKLQNETGGWYGSYAVSENPEVLNTKEFPTYIADGEISWAVKYFLDAVSSKCRLEFERQAFMFQDKIAKEDGRYKVVLNEIMNMQGNQLKICDIGCGKGRFLKNIAEDVENVLLYGVDISQNILNTIDFPIEKKQGSITYIPYKDCTFDVVFFVEALEHAILIENAVKEMARVTKKNGKIIVVDKNKKALGQLAIDSWEQWFADDIFEKIASALNLRLEVKREISYDGNEPDGLFNAWIFTK